MDKKLVNTEEQNRAVNPGDSAYQEESISQEPAHNPAIDTHTETERTTEESSRTPADAKDEDVEN